MTTQVILRGTLVPRPVAVAIVARAVPITGAVIAGAVVDHFDYSWAFLLTGVLGIIAAGLWFFGRETRPRQPASTQ